MLLDILNALNKLEANDYREGANLAHQFQPHFEAALVASDADQRACTDVANVLQGMIGVVRAKGVSALLLRVAVFELFWVIGSGMVTSSLGPAGSVRVYSGPPLKFFSSVELAGYFAGFATTLVNCVERQLQEEEKWPSKQAEVLEFTMVLVDLLLLSKGEGAVPPWDTLRSIHSVIKGVREIVRYGQQQFADDVSWLNYEKLCDSISYEKLCDSISYEKLCDSISKSLDCHEHRPLQGEEGQRLSPEERGAAGDERLIRVLERYRDRCEEKRKEFNAFFDDVIGRFFESCPGGVRNEPDFLAQAYDDTFFSMVRRHAVKFVRWADSKTLLKIARLNQGYIRYTSLCCSLHSLNPVESDADKNAPYKERRNAMLTMVVAMARSSLDSHKYEAIKIVCKNYPAWDGTYRVTGALLEHGTLPSRENLAEHLIDVAHKEVLTGLDNGGAESLMYIMKLLDDLLKLGGAQSEALTSAKGSLVKLVRAVKCNIELVLPGAVGDRSMNLRQALDSALEVAECMNVRLTTGAASSSTRGGRSTRLLESRAEPVAVPRRDGAANACAIM